MVYVDLRPFRILRCLPKIPGAAAAQALRADRRGTVAFEVMFVYLFLITAILLPFSDFATFGFKYLRAWKALHTFGQYVLAKPPANPADTTNWAPANSTTAVGDYTISKVTVLCGDTSAGVPCTSSNVGTSPIKYATFSTTVTFTPMVLSSILCANATTAPCTFTLSYSGRFN